MPRLGRRTEAAGGIDRYDISIRQFQQQILPKGLPATTVWGYGSPDLPGAFEEGGSFHSPSFSIEARHGTPVRVNWRNELMDRSGRYLPHLLPVDQTLHWANPPGPPDEHTMDPGLYRGPVPIVTHLHGGHTMEESDGYPEAWFLPAASNLQSYFRAGDFYGYFREVFRAKYGEDWKPGTATFQYTNDQRATALWFHDHALGLVRQNVYAGPAGFYFLRGGPGDEVQGRLPAHELPLIIQDRSFNKDGSLFYPDSRAFFDGFNGPYIPDSDISPIWNAEFFGNTIMVNGRTWPFMKVERRRYRLRVLNACNSRFLMLKFDNGMPFWQIGADGGFLPSPLPLDRVLLAPAERADLIVDFSEVRNGRKVTLLNLGPDEPFGGGEPGEDFGPAEPGTTGQVMQFQVIETRSMDASTRPDRLELPPPFDLGPAVSSRGVSFNEYDSEVLPDVGPRAGLLGQVDLTQPDGPVGIGLRWMDPPTENPIAGATEVWEVYDFTEDAHPLHIHQVQFEVINREVFDPESPDKGQVLPPAPSETGRKDTVIVYPGTITRLKARFDLPGRYVWHCHILEHEDNEMMRPLIVS